MKSCLIMFIGAQCEAQKNESNFYLILKESWNFKKNIDRISLKGNFREKS